MIEVTDEMVEAFLAHGVDESEFLLADMRAGLAAVLAIVERDLGLIGLCSVALPHFVDKEIGEFCELPHGHTGDHESGPTRWRERS